MAFSSITVVRNANLLGGKTSSQITKNKDNFINT